MAIRGNLAKAKANADDQEETRKYRGDTVGKRTAKRERARVRRGEKSVLVG